jgi:hypothetical protein
MWGWFKRKRVDRPEDDGASPAAGAPIIEVAPAGEPGMRIGRPERAWKLSARYAVERGDERNRALAAGGYAVYLDLTDWLRPPVAPAPVTARVDQPPSPTPETTAPAGDGELTITLPKRRLMGLTLGLQNFTDEQLARLGWTRDERFALTDRLIAATGGADDYATAPDYMHPTLPRAGWARIMAVLAAWSPTSPEQQLLRSDLRAIIGAGMTRPRAAA